MVDVFRETEINLSVRYDETDQMGVVHHANYARYFEVARMEQFRIWGYPYEKLESSGILLMLVDMELKIRQPAFFGEVLAIQARIEKMTRFRIVHRYHIRNSAAQTVATGKTALVSVCRERIPVPLPDGIYNFRLSLER